MRPCAAIEHRGPSIHSGHYVAHVDDDDGWLCFDDESVHQSSTLKKAYILCLEQVIIISEF